MEGWRDLVSALFGVAHFHRQTAYAGQQEWAFVKHVTLDIGMDFQVVDDVLRYIFLPALF